MRVRIRSERIVTPAGVVAGVLAVEGETVVAVSSGERVRGREVDVVDAGSSWVLPGFIDTHVHGGGGAQFDTTDEEEIRAVCRFHARHGTTALLATTVSAPVQTLVEVLRAHARVAGHRGAEEAVVLGTHLEGPFLSKRLPGAMDVDTFLEPSDAELARLLAAGAVRWMTVAPELPGGLDLVRRLAAEDIVAAVGHSDASYEEVCVAVSAGVRAVTHLFNAMPPLAHRAPGVVGAALDRPELSLELICDGVHVDPAVMRLAVRAAGPGRMRLVTDAIVAAGMPDGEYVLGGALVRVRSGRAGLADAPEVIAGSTLTLDHAVRNAAAWLGVGVPELSAMVSGEPARLLGLAGRKGQLIEGADADVVVLDDELRVQAVLVLGEWVRPPL